MKLPSDNKSKSKKINRVLYVTLSLFIFTLIILVLCIANSRFADWYNAAVSAFLRITLSAVTGFLPFSLAELCVVLIPALIVWGAVYSVRCVINKSLCVRSLLKKVLITVFCAFTVFVNVFGVCYFATELEDRLNLKRIPMERAQLYEDAVYTRKLLIEASEKVQFDDKGASVNPHSYSETDRLVDEGYEVLSRNGVYKSLMVGKSKQIALSGLMTYTHISGMYMPFTGEANVNTNYPDYVVAFTIAHEKAHQRGIASEDEANFMAFLACMASGDDYLVYAALMNMYDYYLDETLVQDTEMYTELVDTTPEVIIREMYAYYEFFQKYTDSHVSKVADKVNDTYIKVMGDEEGTKSYGLVIELYHAYIKKEGMKYN